MVTMEPSAFGSLLKRFRTAAGLTQEELAEKARLSTRAISDLERGVRRTPYRDTVQQLADALELSADDRGRLSAAARPIRLPAVDPPGGSQPPLESPPAVQPTSTLRRANLPDEPTSFIGREREIRDICGLLGEPHTRLLTLLGPGGTGKTRLASKAGVSVLDDFRDGGVFVPLASLSAPELVPAAIAGTLGLKEESSSALTETLARYLSDRHLLLILDNFEHVLAAASVVGELLDACRELHVLVTSRMPLHLSREHEYQVPPLAVPNPQQQPSSEQLAQFEAVMLFTQRARAVKPEFAVTDENASVVAEICARLDGLPLALELAAAQLRLFPPPALLRRLARRLQFLTGGPVDVPARHQTLRATIDWSYGLLRTEEKELFARLSVFRGGCSLEAIAAVSGDRGEPEGEVLAGVASLVEKSLLRQDGDQEPRFVMLETIREYASERLEEAGAAKEVREMHARHFLSLAEEAAVLVNVSEQRAWLDRLDVERDNLRAALQWAREHGDMDVGPRLALALRGFWMLRGPLSEGRGWLTAFAAADTISPPLRAATLSAAGRLAAAEGRRTESTELMEQSLAPYRDRGDHGGLAEALGWLPMSWYMIGEVERAAELLRWSEREARETGDQALLALSLHWQAAVVSEQADAERTRELGEASLALYRDLGNSKGIADVLRILASAAYGEGDRARARALTDDLLALLVRSPLDPETEDWLEPLAYRARTQGDYVYAWRVLESLAARADGVGDRRVAVRARAGLGLLAREQGDYARAAALYNEGVVVLQEVGDLLGLCRALIGLSDVARDQGDADQVIAHCEQSLALLREAGDALLTAFTLHNLGLAAWYQGERDHAEQLLAESLGQIRRINHVIDAAEVQTSVGLLALDAGQYDRARDMFAESLAIARDTRSHWIMTTLLEGMAGVAAGTGQAELAARLVGAAEAARQTMGTPRWPALQSLHERHVAVATAALGRDGYLHCVGEGRALSLDEAIAYTLQKKSG
jgi:predicted ATPase/transcriptional regulator with XRE-family HTH domain